jgi:hypothetical protein
MTVRAKFYLSAITERVGGGKTLRFETQYDSSIPEDVRFTKATPWGSVEMQIDNPAAIEQFKLGSFYYADFAPVPVPETTAAAA